MPIEDKALKSGNKKSVWKWLLPLLLIIILGACFFYFFIRIKHIDAGYVAVKSSLSDPIDNTSNLDVTTLTGGYVVYMPMNTDVTMYPTTIQTASYDNMTISTKDGMQFIIKPRISYQIDESKAPLLYKNHRGNFHDLNKTYLKEVVAGSYSAIALNFDSDSLINNMATFDNEVHNNLSSKISSIGLVLKNANGNMEIPQKIKELVDQRNLAKHNTLLAQEKYKEAYAEANVTRVKDSLINSALTDLSIKKMFIEKWDGRLISTPIEVPQVFKDTTKRK